MSRDNKNKFPLLLANQKKLDKNERNDLVLIDDALLQESSSSENFQDVLALPKEMVYNVLGYLNVNDRLRLSCRFKDLHQLPTGRDKLLLQMRTRTKGTMDDDLWADESVWRFAVDPSSPFAENLALVLGEISSERNSEVVRKTVAQSVTDMRSVLFLCAFAFGTLVALLLCSWRIDIHIGDIVCGIGLAGIVGSVYFYKIRNDEPLANRSFHRFRDKVTLLANRASSIFNENNQNRGNEQQVDIAEQTSSNQLEK
jgi:hypothetical protein